MDVEAFRDLVLAFEGVTESPHFERRAFRARRNFATLGEDGSLNVLLTPEEQAFYVDAHPAVLSPVPNKWGARGWTRLALDKADAALVEHLMRAAWAGSR
ncbi:MmcQ/YjbR family DNA-binding protein [Acuticoccus kandeliae]|uniref:MmcQ/YjbR family DNA-binding protein n=1 Tax=Acuticoccus kandeliae TaxID=2073160 RepID=UPI000D3E5DF9|nr:MmcQ/YjbR family DNA-binding protein [Acuticoccus kandeliae]